MPTEECWIVTTSQAWKNYEIIPDNKEKIIGFFHSEEEARTRGLSLGPKSWVPSREKPGVWNSPDKSCFLHVSKLDDGVSHLVRAMSLLPGIQTSNSCDGHGEKNILIFFHVLDYTARGFLTLSRLLSHNYYLHSFKGWQCLLWHQDVRPQVCFLLQGPVGDFESSRALAQDILDLAEKRVQGFNILYGCGL